MFKRILNQLLGNSPDSMNTHTIDDVREVLYNLIAQHRNTTKLDVKNELRQRGFQAFQEQVSQMVNVIATQDNLSFHYNGKFYIYSFGFDSNEAKHVYMERQQEFWEAKTEKNSIVIYSGKAGTDGTEEKFNFYKNSIAIRELNRRIAEKMQQGFSLATDVRPPLEIRKKYGHLMGKVPASCSIGYFNVTKKEQVSNQMLIKSSGYTFTWNMSLSRQEFIKVITQPGWNSSDVRYDNAQLLGEKVMHREPASVSLQPVQFEADNNNIFQIELTFETGEKALFSKFGMDMKNTVLPLLKQFVNK